MRWVLPIVLLLSGTAAGAHHAERTLAGKVVAVPEVGSVWVYLDSAQASYHFQLSGISVPESQSDPAVREALARWILNREVRVRVAALVEDRVLPADLFVDGQSVNQRLACHLAGGPPMPTPRSNPSPRRPVLAILLAPFRLLPTWSDWHSREY